MWNELWCTTKPANRPRQMPGSASASAMPERLAWARKLLVIRSATTIRQTAPGSFGFSRRMYW
jgi:hypothetical protein